MLVIDNLELVAELGQAEAEKTVADAELQRIDFGTRPEIIHQRKAEIDRATADLTLAQQTYNRTKQRVTRTPVKAGNRVKNRFGAEICPDRLR